MKKILSILILGIFLIGLVAPMLAQAQEDLPSGCKLTKEAARFDGTATRCAAVGSVCDPTQTGMEDCGMCCLLNIVYVVCDWIFYLMMIAIVIIFVIAAAMFMLAGGDVEKTKNAKGMMILGIVGLIIALVAKLVPSIVKLIVAM